MRAGCKWLGTGAWALVAAAGLVAAGEARGQADAASAPSKGGAEAPARKDLLIFKDGRTVEGQVLEETDLTVRIRVMTSVGLAVETTYQKSELSKIERGGGSANGAAPAPEAKPAGDTATPKAQAPVDPNAAKLYVIEMTGKFGRAISVTPLRKAVQDARKHQPDFIIVKIDNDWKVNEFQERSDDQGAFDELFKAENLAPVLTDEIRDDDQWVKKPTLVVWVKKAMGGAAFLPFITPNVYFASDGRQGGIAGIEKIFGSTGDEMVREKQFSLRLGHARGLANKGGHDPKLIEAMARTDYVLSVSFVGGKPVYFEDTTGQVLLTDDGKDDNEDTDAMIVSGRSNDCLTLDADMAYKLGVSKGTVDDLDQLKFELGIARNATVVEGKSSKLWEDWSQGVNSAEKELESLGRRFQEIQVGGEYEDRRRGRGLQINNLEKQIDLLTRYAEVLDPEDAARSQLRVALERIKQDQRRDRR